MARRYYVYNLRPSVKHVIYTIVIDQLRRTSFRDPNVALILHKLLNTHHYQLFNRITFKTQLAIFLEWCRRSRWMISLYNYPWRLILYLFLAFLSRQREYQNLPGLTRRRPLRIRRPFCHRFLMDPTPKPQLLGKVRTSRISLRTWEGFRRRCWDQCIDWRTINQY